MSKEKKTTGFFAEFRKFVARGNVIDLAVGVIIGGAFSSITNSLVNDIIMPVFSAVLGGINFSDWKWVLKAATDTTEAITVNYGAFLSAVLNGEEGGGGPASPAPGALGGGETADGNP